MCVRKQDKSLVTSVPLKPRIILGMCFPAPPGTAERSEFTSDYPLQLAHALYIPLWKKKAGFCLFVCFDRIFHKQWIPCIPISRA